MEYYVYAHLDSSGSIRYIGKGSKNRAWDFVRRNTEWKAVFNKKNRPTVKILKSSLCETDAYAYEAKLIREHKDEITNPPKPGYWTGKKRDPETIAKIQKTKKENPKPGPWAGKTRPAFSQEHKDKISSGNMGKKHSEQTKAKISAANKGKIGNRNGATTSEDTKLKMAAARKKAWDSGKYEKAVKPVICLDSGQKFKSISEAANYNKSVSDGISGCCNGRQKTSRGKRWAFL